MELCTKMPKLLKFDNLKWLVTNAINGDVSGDCPEDLTKMLAASQELQAVERHFKEIEQLMEGYRNYNRAETAKLMECSRFPYEMVKKDESAKDGTAS
jgi:hypothetical protein